MNKTVSALLFILAGLLLIGLWASDHPAGLASWQWMGIFLAGAAAVAYAARAGRKIWLRRRRAAQKDRPGEGTDR